MSVIRKPKLLRDPDPWMLGEDAPDMDLFFSQIWLSGFPNQYKVSGIANSKILAVYRGYHLWFYYGEQDSKRVGDLLVAKFVKEPAFTKKINQNIIRCSDQLRAFSETIPVESIQSVSNRKLWEIYEQFDDLHTKYYEWAWMPVAVDMFHNNLTERLKQYLRSIDVPEACLNEDLMVLTQPITKSLIQVEQDEFVELAIRIQTDARLRKLFRTVVRRLHQPKTLAQVRTQLPGWLTKKLEAYTTKYGYVKFLWIGKEGVNDVDHYLRELIQLVCSTSNLRQSHRKQQQKVQRELQKRKALIRKLKIKDPWLTIFTQFGEFMVTKIYRRYAQIYAVYRMQPVLHEIARRHKLSLLQVRFMLTREVKEVLLRGKLNRKELTRRSRLAVSWNEKGLEEVYTGMFAKQLLRQIPKVKTGDVSELHGQTGCVGKATGTVKIVIRPADMKKFKKGDILVSIATDPDIVSAMKKAAAIVTEQGGVTSHAAIVSRELGVPCVIGTKIATKVLKDGDRVEVDATKGIVRKL